MPVYTTTDHRYLDGVLGAKMINKVSRFVCISRYIVCLYIMLIFYIFTIIQFKEYFEHPEKIFPDDSDILSSL